MSVRWQATAQLRHNSIPPRLLDCLLYTGSLTRYLESWCEGELRLQLNNKSWQKPLSDEAIALGLGSGRHALVREITFNCGNKPWVYGRSIIPTSTLRGAERRLVSWGQRSLGNYLFSGRDILRGPIEVARINPGSTLHKLATVEKPDTESIWGRRSIFYIKGKPLLVVEIFLDSLAQCMTDSIKL